MATVTSLNEHQVMSSEALLEMFLSLTKSTKWKDDRVEHSYALMMGSLVHASNRMLVQLGPASPEVDLNYQHHLSSHSGHIAVRPHLFIQSGGDQGKSSIHKRVAVVSVSFGSIHCFLNNHFLCLQEKVIKYLLTELDQCKSSDCRVVYLHALGNARMISKHGVFMALRKQAIDSGKRESVAALKSMKLCLDEEFSSTDLESNIKFMSRLTNTLIRIVYDSSLDTTSRLIASELLSTHFDGDGEILLKLMQHLDRFPVELATMIWKRAVEAVHDKIVSNSTLARVYNDWNLHAKVLSGSSASFKYVMGGTRAANLSYGVDLEMLKGTLPKETLFKFDIDTEDSTQEVISVGMFAGGLSSLAGGTLIFFRCNCLKINSFLGSDDDETDQNEIDTSDGESESTMAGLSLQVLGAHTRPIIFFRSTGELMGHVWSGTGSEPTSVYRSNLLLADYFEVRPLINGFLLEQSFKGVFSINLLGEIQISIWSRNSHSNVQTLGAVLFQGSQEIFTSDRKTSARKFFSFGTETNLDFITDFDFASAPYRICIQIVQPDFVFR